MTTPNIEVYTGCMFSGKTRAIISRTGVFREMGRSVTAIKPAKDTRHAEECFVSHNGDKMQAKRFSLDSKDMPEPADLLVIDEVQFVSQELLQTWIFSGSFGYVLAAGLDLDWQGRPFGSMPWLLCVATDVVKLAATCNRCGKAATRSRLLDVTQAPTDGSVYIGGADRYEPNCVECFGAKK